MPRPAKLGITLPDSIKMDVYASSCQIESYTADIVNYVTHAVMTDVNRLITEMMDHKPNNAMQALGALQDAVNRQRIGMTLPAFRFDTSETPSPTPESPEPVASGGLHDQFAAKKCEYESPEIKPVSLVDGNTECVDYVDRAALKVNGYIVSLPRPARHNDVWHYLIAHYPDIVALNPEIRIRRNAEQFGFLTQSGKWLDREAAKKHVKKIGQRARFSENTQDLRGLFTEDLWGLFE